LGVVAWSWKAKPQAAQYRAVPIQRSLHRNLLILLHNDQQAANRLIRQAQAKHPNRSLDWCAEKVIYDSQRDRH
jgi:hypothetical protein